MSRQSSSIRPRCLLIMLELLLGISTLNGIKVEEKFVKSLTQSELRAKYGQAGTLFNDGSSCNRICDGRKMTCYYEFNVQAYDTMSGLCGGCSNHTIEDCFLDGCVTANGMPRSMITINHQMPGPAINVCKDDRIIVDVTNSLAGQELTIHWHGFHQKETPWSDGVPMVTQCPILSGTTFRYQFYARQVGTHYYHSHSGLQRTNGLIGAINVRDPDDPNALYYDFDLPEHSVLLSDWTNQLAEEMAPGIRNQIIKPDSLLINGFGSYTDPKTGIMAYAPTAVFYCQRGKRFRFRIDNAGSHHCPMEFSIKNHKLTVVATDGYSVEPVIVDSVVTAAGERVDVVITAMDDPFVDETIMTVRAIDRCAKDRLQTLARIIFVDSMIDYPTKFDYYEPFQPNAQSYDSLNYPKITLNNPHDDCTKPGSVCIASLQQKRVEQSVGGSLRDVDAKVIPFEFHIQPTQTRPSHYFSSSAHAVMAVINNIANVGTPMPGLTQNDSTVSYCNADNRPSTCTRGEVCHCPHQVKLELCETYEFLLLAEGLPGGNINHPMHLHGYGFQVIDMGFKDQLHKGQTAFRNATHLPVVKDTVMVQSGGFVRLRFRACNPGHWFFHCHYEYHMHVGMALTIKVGNDTDMIAPPVNFPTCGNYLTPAYEIIDDEFVEILV